MRITQTAARATKTTHLIALYFVVLMYSIFLTIFFNVDRADQLDCRRWRDNIKKVVRQMLRTDQLQISCRSQKWCHHHVLSAADQQERPSAVNDRPDLHVL